MIIIIISATIGFHCITIIRYVELGIWWVCADPWWGVGGGGSVPSWKITSYIGRSRSKPPPAPDEFSWFRACGGGGGVGAIYFTGMHLNRLHNGGTGLGVSLYQLGAWDWLKMMAFTWLR